MKSILKTFVPGLAALMAAVLVLTACNQDQEALAEAEAQAYVVDAVTSLEDSAQCGNHGCFEFVFPITIAFADSSTATANDVAELRAAIYAWIQANPGERPHPRFVYPFDVLDSDGNLITITSARELHRLRESCGRGFRGPRHRGRRGFGDCGTPCFTLNFPLTVQFPDSTTASVSDRQAFHQAVRTWRANNPGVPGRPQLVFPLTVTLEDGTTVTVNDRQELGALKRSCQGS